MGKGKTLRDLIPDAASLDALHTSELGGYVLEVLLGIDQSQAGWLHRGNFCRGVADAYSDDLRAHGPHSGALQACAEAWHWLEINQLICQQPKGEGWYFVTKKGYEVRNAAGVKRLVESEELPQAFLNRAFLKDVRSLFMQGRYDTAVFEAFRVLEVAIRDQAKLGIDLIGTKLAARAFHPENGELTDLSAEMGERVALMNLMSGAIGSYKNPQSHRHVGVAVGEAREMIIIASHLLNIVHSRPQVA